MKVELGRVVKKGDQQFVVTEVGKQGVCGVPITADGRVDGGNKSAGTIWPPFDVLEEVWGSARLKQTLLLAGFTEEQLSQIPDY